MNTSASFLDVINFSWCFLFCFLLCKIDLRQTLIPITFANFLEITRQMVFYEGDLINDSNVWCYEIPLYCHLPLVPKWPSHMQYLTAELIYSCLGYWLNSKIQSYIKCFVFFPWKPSHHCKANLSKSNYDNKCFWITGNK